MKLVTFVIFFAVLLPVKSQELALGVKGGIRATDDIDGFSVLSSESKRYIAGPMLDLRLPWRLAVEFDALYRTFGYTSQFSSCCAYAIRRERANSWEFPLILKYRVPLRVVHPYAGIGYAPRKVSGSDVSSGYFLSGMTTDPPMSIYTYYSNSRTATDYAVSHGLVLSGGIDLDAKHVRISPELRYVHWNSPFLDQYGGDGSYSIHSTQNELFVAVGISWHR